MSSQRRDGEGPNGFRRLAESIMGFFRSGSTGPAVQGTQGNAPAPDAVKRALTLVRLQTESSAIKSRAQLTRDHLAVFDNDFQTVLLHRLKSAFHPENYERIKFVLHSSSNVMQRILKETCILYQNPAKRSLKVTKVTQTAESAGAESTGTPEPLAKDVEAPEVGTGDIDVDALAEVLKLSGSESSTEATPFDNLQAAYDLDTLLDLVEKLTSICPVVWVRPVVTYEETADGVAIADTGKLNFVVYTPATADVVLDPKDCTKALAFYYYAEDVLPVNGELQKVPVIHFWNKESYIEFAMDWKVLRQVDHKLGRLPVTAFRAQLPREGYFCEGVGNDLFEATIELCLLKTLQNSRCKDGAFKQLAIQGDPENVQADLVMGGPTPIMLGDENVATVLDMQANLAQFTEMWKERELSTATTHGLTEASYKHQGGPVSGFAKKLDKDKVLEESRRRRKFFQRAEQDLYHNTATVLREYPIPNVGQLDPLAELQVDFAEPTFEEDPQTQARTDAIALKYNLVSILDILRRENPDLNDVELIRLAYQKKRINDVFMTEDQLRLVDLLSTRAIVGASLGKGNENATPPTEDTNGQE